MSNFQERKTKWELLNALIFKSKGNKETVSSTKDDHDPFLADDKRTQN